MDRFKEREGVFVVVDDIVCWGKEIKRVKKILDKSHPEKKFIFSTAYILEENIDYVDCYGETISKEKPPLWEWNFMDRRAIGETILDLDGLLCEDAPVSILKNSEKYIDFILNVGASSYIPRKISCDCILTGRSEKYRAFTEKWLEKHGVLYKELYMHPDTTGKLLHLSELCDYKSDFFCSSDAKLLIESNCSIAECIARNSGKDTLCLPEGKYFKGENLSMKKDLCEPKVRMPAKDRITECQCESPGYCPMYCRTMGPNLHSKCQNSQSFRDTYLHMQHKMQARSLPEAREKRLKRKEEEEKVGKQFDLAVEELKEEGLSLEDAHSEGLGDTIEKVLSKFGITTKLVENLAGITKCRCKERKKWLNKIFPYRKKEKE